MEFDPKILDEIKSMDQRELAKKIEEVSALLGIDSRMVKQMVGDPDSISKRLGDLNEQDIRRLSKKIDKKTLENIKKMDQR